MDHKNIRKVCNALRSGLYQHGHTTLCNREGQYCVGGVVTDIFLKDIGELKVTTFLHEQPNIGDCLGPHCRKLQEWLGLDFEGMDEFANLTQTLNAKEVAFSEVASMLESFYGLNKIRGCLTFTRKEPYECYQPPQIEGDGSQSRRIYVS